MGGGGVTGGEGGSQEGRGVYWGRKGDFNVLISGGVKVCVCTDRGGGRCVCVCV